MSAGKRNALMRITSQSLRSTFQTPSPLPNTRTIRTHFTPQHKPDLVYLPWVRNDPEHLLAAAVNARIRERPRDTLWWCVITPVGVSARKTVRNWLERRVRVAVVEALRWRGFDADGRWIGRVRSGVGEAAARWLEETARPLGAGAVAGENLVGSLRLAVSDAGLTAPIASVRQDVVTILDRLILRRAGMDEAAQGKKRTAKNKHAKGERA